MKKSITLLSIMALLSTCAVCTSCTDSDTEEAMVLSGQWQGNWGMYYDYLYAGNIYTFNSYDTDIVFYPDYDYATHGYGYQVDWYREGPYSRLSYRFTWRIDNGVIRMHYPGYEKYNTTIRDYRINNNRFTGYFDTGTEPFYLYKITDYYDWGYYSGYGDYHYWLYDEWSWDYYAKTRGITIEDNSGNASAATEGCIVKIGSHLAE